MSHSPGPNAAGLPPPDADARAHMARVQQHIRRRIEDAGGWIPFAVFMDLALHAPGLGYYAAGSQKFGSQGDFVTAPEMTPLFGRTLAIQVADVLRLTGGDVLEIGAGSGALAADMLAELERIGVLPRRYLILEPSAELVSRQRQHLRQRLPRLLERVEWLDSLDAGETNASGFRGVMLANEVLDALPVHLLVWRDRSVYERGVVLHADEFAWEERPASDALLELAENVRPETDVSDAPYVSEVCPAVTGLISGLTGLIESGILMVIDYGFPRTEYFHPQRSGGTLMCHYRHHVHDDPFFLPGLQDITAHVDFTLVAEAGVDAGCTLAGYTTQAQFLLNCGITGLLAETSSEDVAAYLPQSTAVQKLLSPAEMGELFKVMALTRGIDGPLRGFQEGDRSARL